MQGHVTILGFTPNIEAMIASGGRISTMDGTADEIFETSIAAGREKNEKLIGKVLSSGHTSVLEHGFVNLAFENVSVLAEQFLIEFRLASFTVKSRRYVDFSRAGYVSPDWTDDVQKTIFDETVRGLFAIYDELEAAGVPKEDARFVLPYCFCSNFSMDAGAKFRSFGRWVRACFCSARRSCRFWRSGKRTRTPKRRCRCRMACRFCRRRRSRCWTERESPKSSSAARRISQTACRRRD